MQTCNAESELSLGHMISDSGVEMEKAKLEKVKNYPKPSIIKGVRAFLGLCNYYRRFVKGFANIAKPLNELMKKDTKLERKKSCENAFQTLKNKLTS